MNINLNTIIYLLDDLFSGTGEVIRIEKTLEVSDDNTSDEEEKTLSLSNENLLNDPSADPFEETDNDEDSEIKMYAELLPPLVVIETLQDRKIKSMSLHSNQQLTNIS